MLFKVNCLKILSDKKYSLMKCVKNISSQKNNKRVLNSLLIYNFNLGHKIAIKRMNIVYCQKILAIFIALTPGQDELHLICFFLSKSKISRKSLKYQKMTLSIILSLFTCSSCQQAMRHWKWKHKMFFGFFCNTGGPHYMRSFYLRIRIYAIENDVLL